MIAKIFSFILGIINYIVLFIIKMVLTVFPIIDITGFSSVFNAFFGLLEGATTMTYFLVGDMTATFFSIVATLWSIKHVVLPITNFVRKILIK